MHSNLLKTEALYHLTSVAAPAISPCGQLVVYVATTVNELENNYTSQLYCYNIQTKETIQWTNSTGRNYAPLWSPDGRHLLFLSTRLGTAQVYTLATSGGEAIKQTDEERAIETALWSPLSNALLFTTQVKDEGAIQQSLDEEKITAKIIDTMIYRKDTIGYIDPESHYQIFHLNLETKEKQQLTAFPTDCKLSDISADGLKILYSRSTQPGNEFHFETGIFELDIATGIEQNITDCFTLQAFSSAAYSPDQNYIAMTGSNASFKSLQVASLFIYERASEKIIQDYSQTDLYVGDVGTGDFKQKATTPAVQWLPTSDGLLVTISQWAKVSLYTFNINGTIEPYLAETEHVFDFSIAPDAQSIVAAISTPTSPNELYLIDMNSKNRQQLTAFNAHYLSTIQLTDYEELQYTATDGSVVHGFLIKPAEFATNETYPLIYNIHGGPHVMHAATFFHEAQVMSARGFAVLLINPRGSHGYGQAFTNGVIGHYGEGDYQDLLFALDSVLAENSWIDLERLHVTGGSYGGFMTNWIVTQTNRFKSAATQRSYCNILSKTGSSDIGFYYTGWELDTDILNFKEMWQRSPLKYVENVKTPLLFIHSEEDYRCPISEAEQFYTYLKYLGQKTRFMRFPKSSHELSRNGIPSLRIERLEAIINWFE